MIHVLIADDQPLVRQGLRMLLTVLPGLEVSGEAQDGEDAVRLAHALRPHLIIMDAHMPHRDGLSATAEIKRRFPKMLVIIISVESRDDLRKSAAAAGAFAFAEKSSGQSTLIREVKRAIETLENKQN